MKNIVSRIKYTMLAVLMLTFNSCSEDFINLEPANALASNLAFQSMSDVELQLVGAYSGLVSASYMTAAIPVYGDILSDNAVQTSDNQGQQVFFHNHQYAADDGSILGIWTRIYQTIERANITLEESENFEEEFAGQKAQIQGQAYALRALCHFDLLRLFSRNLTNGQAPGVIIKTQSRTLESFPRSTIDAVLTQVNSDLQMARTLLDGNDPNDNYRIGFDAANAISARVALYSEDWQNAIDYASEVISGRTLASGSDFSNIWTLDDDGGSDELVWSIAHTQNDGEIGDVLWNQPSDLLYWAPAQSLLSLYDQANDVRFSSYFQPRPSNPSQFIDGKYRGRAPGGVISNFGLHDVKAIRLSEMYLIRAEAEVELNGNSASATSDLNTLRSARIAGYVNASFPNATDLQNAIQDERRKELAFEGHRWFDLKRRDSGMTRGADCDLSPAVNCSLDSDDHRWIWPIPQEEIFANPMQQNSGY